MANTGPTLPGSSVRYWVIDTNSSAIDLGTASPGKVGSFAIHAVSDSATGNGITVAATQVGAESLSGWITADYEEDNTAVAGSTKITATGRYYVRCDHTEKVRLSFEITGGSWKVAVSQGPG
jgi:hypothetical protein